MAEQWNRLDIILPDENLASSEQSLRTYWSRFRSLYSQHEIFDSLSNEDLDRTIPIKLHGDEGRSASTLMLKKRLVV